MRILIVRLSALGDAVLTLPLYFTLRDYFPDAFIGWVIEERNAGLLAAVPHLDRVHLWRKKDKNLAGAWRLAQEIRAENYDVALDAQGLSKSAVLPFFAGIKRRIGFKRAPLEARELAPLLNNTLVSPPAEITHIAARSLYLAAPLGVQPAPRTPRTRLAPPEDAVQYINDWKATNGITKPLFLFGIGTSWETKIWPIEYVARLVAEAARRNYQPVITWGPEEEPRLPQWRQILDQRALLGPKTRTVAELIALVNAAARYAGPDSAPLHLAWIFNKPTFSWFGPSCSRRGGPTGDTHKIIVAFPPTRERHGEPMWCLKPETVLPEFTAWLDHIPDSAEI